MNRTGSDSHFRVIFLINGAAVPEEPGNCLFDKNCLYVTDSAKILNTLLDSGCAAAAYVHAGNREEDMSRAPYLLEDIEDIDEDSYRKIYERSAGIPWTILETERCIVRELCPEDAAEVLSLYDEEALRFTESPLQNEEEEKKSLAAYAEKVYGFFGYGTWAVIDKESGRLIGRAGYEPFARPDGAMSFGYIIHPDFRNRGYALEVCGPLLEYGRNVLGFEAIEADADPGNTASVNLLARLGFRKTGGNTYRYEQD